MSNSQPSTPRVHYDSQASTPRGNYDSQPSTPRGTILNSKRKANIEKGTQYITPTWRKALIKRNGKDEEELHFQTLVNGVWGPANAHGNPLPEYSNKSNTRVTVNSPSLNTFNSSEVKTILSASNKNLKKNLKKEFNNAHGGKHKLKKKTQKKKRIYFSKKGKKTRCIRR